jgi:DNA transformation protein
MGGFNMGELSKLQNIGEVVADQLNQVGIETFEQLKADGSKQAWLKIKAIDDSACIHRLYALEGAIQGIKKTDLSVDKKEELKEFYNRFKG